MGPENWGRLCASAFAFAVLFTAATSIAATPGDAFVCYTTGHTDGEPRLPKQTVSVRDQRSTRDILATAPRRLCLPADTGDGVIDPDTALLGFKARLPKGAPGFAAGNAVQTMNALGDLNVDISTKPLMLLVPTATNPNSDPTPPDPGAHNVDHYRCHKAQPSEGQGLAAGQQVVIEHGSATPATFDLIKLRSVCEPVDAQGLPFKNAGNYLACYKAKRARGQAKYQPLTALHVANELGFTRIDTRRDAEICLPTRAIDRCNGSRQLCDRAFDAVSYPTTHNAMSNLEDHFLGPNQYFTVKRQLDDGIRGLMLDTWYFGGDVVLCHGGDVVPCNTFGMRPLVDTLTDIRVFLDQHPTEIVSIIFESYVTEADTEADFIASGLIQYAFAQPQNAAWPTLRSMIEADQRLVVFTDDSDVTLPWHHYVWDYAWETHYSFRYPTDFSCNINRGSMSNSLFILNHFLTAVFGSPQLADSVNHNPLFIDRAEQCEAESGRLPNFVTVDYYDIGDVFRVVNALNGVTP